MVGAGVCGGGMEGGVWGVRGGVGGGRRRLERANAKFGSPSGGRQMLAAGLLAVGATTPRESASALAPSEEDHYPNLLALLSDHGTGSTELSLVLNAHKCVFSIGEPFGGSDYHHYSQNTNYVGETGEDSLYMSNGDPGNLTSNEKIAMMVNIAAKETKYPAWDVSNLAPDFHLKDGASFSINSYFGKLRKCAPAPPRWPLPPFPALSSADTSPAILRTGTFARPCRRKRGVTVMGDASSRSRSSHATLVGSTQTTPTRSTPAVTESASRASSSSLSF